MKKEKKRKVKKRTTTDRDRLIISKSDRFLMLYTCDAVDEIMGFIYLIMIVVFMHCVVRNLTVKKCIE